MAVLTMDPRLRGDDASFPRIVLVETSHPGNIGATARAMKTMGLSSLYLVNPEHFPHPNASEMSAGADDILHNAIIVDTLSAALAECTCAIATTARSRMIELPELTPEQAANFTHTEISKGQIAFVFGRERTGLFNDELLQCNYQVTIPTNPNYSSLNLAQAVQIMAYEWKKHCGIRTQPTENIITDRPTSAEVEAFYQHLQSIMLAIDFLKPTSSKRLMQKIRRLFNRSQLEKTEVNILRGILTQMEKNLKDTV